MTFSRMCCEATDIIAMIASGHILAQMFAWTIGLVAGPSPDVYVFACSMTPGHSVTIAGVGVLAIEWKNIVETEAYAVRR